MAKKTFKGVIKLDVRDSTPDWSPYTLPTAPKGAPNVLIILYDDTGLAAWSPFGGGINMPTLQKLADNGLMYSQWHTTALCSPTRSTFLTGRNHHLNGCSCITEGAQGFPGWSGRTPAECATIGQVLQDNGFSTFWLGKKHNVPEQDISAGASRSEWPLQKGFDRFYGFLGGETNQWYPDLVDDNKFIDQPYSPEEGYHLSKDLVDQALQMIRDQKASNPSKPWFMWFCPGANHAPHHAPKEYIDKYKGKFDDGYEAYREWVLPRMIEKGILPKDTKLTPINPLPERHRERGRRGAAVEHAQRGREEAVRPHDGGLRRILRIHRRADRPADRLPREEWSARQHAYLLLRGQRRLGRRQPERLSQREQVLQRLPGRTVGEHEVSGRARLRPKHTTTIPTGWAVASSTPFQMFKRYSEYAGGTCCPLVISWPKGIKAKGEVRNQYHHSTDIVPTILDCVGLKMPTVYRGVKQYPLSGVSMRYSFEAKPDTPTKKKRQYYAMLGTRGIWEEGWKAVALHAPLTGKGHFDKDEWELYHVDEDRSESTNLAAKYPDKLKALIKAWFDEAEKNMVLPLDDRTAVEMLGIERPTEEKAARALPLLSGDVAGAGGRRRQRARPLLQDHRRRRDHRTGLLRCDFRARLALRRPRAVHQGQEAALRLQLPRHQAGAEVRLGPSSSRANTRSAWSSSATRPASTASRSARPRSTSTRRSSPRATMKTQPGKFTLAGDGLCVGRDSGDAVSEDYKTPGDFKGGTILGVGVTVEKKQYLDLEKLAHAAFAVD